MSANAISSQKILSPETLKLLLTLYGDFSIYTKNIHCTFMSNWIFGFGVSQSIVNYMTSQDM